MGDNFDKYIEPRMKKVVYSKDWSDEKSISERRSNEVPAAGILRGRAE